MDATGFVVDVHDAAADHYADKHGQGDRAGQQVLHIFDVGIQLHYVQRDLLQHARLDIRLVERRYQVGERTLEGGGHEVVGVIEHQADPWPGVLVNIA